MYSLYEVINRYHSRYMGTYFTIEECIAIIENQLNYSITDNQKLNIKSIITLNGIYILNVDECTRYKIIRGE